MNHSNNQLISIIAPIYNVERYLAQCLDSIINQTYKNIEIILVNDGSTDNSGSIADSLAQKDDRIHVFHKKNKGVSAARNYALEKATGEYVIFVDSDDYISPDFVEYMVKISEVTNAEFCLSTKVFTDKNMTQTLEDKIETYTPEQATCALLYPGIEIGCWNKMFKRSFLEKNNIKFPTSFFMGEGLNFITTAAQLANNIGVGNRKVYYYRTNNAQSATTKFNISKLVNAFEAIDNIWKNLRIRTPKVIMALDFHLWWTHFYALQSMVSTSNEKKYSDSYTKFTKYLKANAFSMLKADVSMVMKIKALCIWISPGIFVKAVIGVKRLRN